MSIEIKNVTHVYNEGTSFEKKALDDVTLTIENGTFVGLIGHTGSGKSTLIQHLNALVKPTKGSIIIDGEDILADKSKLKKVRQNVGLVFQYPEHQLFEMTIYEDVAYGPKNLGLKDDEVATRVKEALNLVGLNEKDYEKSPFQLSGGQKRRVAIAGVLAMKPKVLILDEPTAGLDPKGRDEILQSIKSMHDALKITVILVSHNMEDIAKHVENIIVMHAGKPRLVGSPSVVFKEVEILESIGLAVPQVSYLMKALSEKGIDVRSDIFVVKDAVDAILSTFGKTCKKEGAVCAND